MTNRQNNDAPRLIGLEVLRFGAAVGVLVWHYQHFLFVGHDEAAIDWSRLPFRWLFAPFYTYGYQGVELFWCISGFIFTWKYAALIGRSGLSFGRFALLRFSRLYPLHLATLLIVAALQQIYFVRYGQTFVYMFNDMRHFVMSLLFANWWGFQSGESFNGPSWSVSAEVLIYVFFFWVCRSGSPGDTSRGHTSRGHTSRADTSPGKPNPGITSQGDAGGRWRIDLLALIGFSVAAPLAKTVFGIKLAFTGAGTFFYLGALVCHLYDRIEASGARYRSRIAWGCGGLIVIPVILVATHLLKIAGATLPMFPAAVLLVQLTVRPRGERAQRLLTGLGNLTYASYMLHFPMQLTTMLILGALSVPVQPLAYSDGFMLAYLGTVMMVALIVFRWVERPAQAFLRGPGQPRQGRGSEALGLSAGPHLR